MTPQEVFQAYKESSCPEGLGRVTAMSFGLTCIGIGSSCQKKFTPLLSLFTIIDVESSMQYPPIRASKKGTQSLRSLFNPPASRISIFPPINLSAFLYQSGIKERAGRGGGSLRPISAEVGAKTIFFLLFFIRSRLLDKLRPLRQQLEEQEQILLYSVLLVRCQNNF